MSAFGWLTDHGALFGVVLALGIAAVGLFGDREQAEKVARYGFAFLLGMAITIMWQDQQRHEWFKNRAQWVEKICPPLAGSTDNPKVTIQTKP